MLLLGGLCIGTALIWATGAPEKYRYPPNKAKGMLQFTAILKSLILGVAGVFELSIASKKERAVDVIVFAESRWFM